MQAKTKAFDSVGMKHAIQEEMAKDSAGMTPAEFRAYVERKAKTYRDSARPGKGEYGALFEALEHEQLPRGSR